MLILAGVTLNAAIGDNGIISQAQYATFLNEMAAVEEAVALWKINQKESAIPANGLCQEETLSVATNKNAERLNGEVGYYRVWSMSETMPAISVLADVETFNNNFGAEVVYFPAGAQDLYYLDNEGLGIDSKKEYIIDAVNSMVYSTTGITIKGVRVYSTAMAKAVMNGNFEAPLFAEAEVSGTGSNENLAGNVQEEYLPDGTKNPDYNPYGFQIIASPYSNNIYKLYNNGDLYGKGVKGTQLNTSETEMESINSLNWTEFTVPTEIGSYKQVIQGASTMYVIDSEGYLWAWGNNSSNKLGLTIDEQQEYTGREAIKLNVDGKTVSEVFGFSSQTYVITTDNCLYSMGGNSNYELGLGHNNEISTFTQVKFNDVEKISSIFQATETRRGIIIETTEKEYYATGTNIGLILGKNTSLTYQEFAPIWDGYVYKYDDVSSNYIIDSTVEYDSVLDFDSRIKKVVNTSYVGFLFLFEDNCVYHIGASKYILTATNSYKGLTQLSTDFSTEVKDIYGVGSGMLIWKENGEIWACNGNTDNVGLGGITHIATLVELPNELVNSGIKEIFTTTNAVFYLSNNNILFASSSNGSSLGLEYQPLGVIQLETPQFKTLYPESNNIVEQYSGRTSRLGYNILFESVDGTIYSTNNSEIVFRNNILQKNYTKLASNVSSIALGPNNSIAYIEKNTNNLYVAGEDSRMLGLGTSEQTKIANFTQVNDSKINGKVKEVQFGNGMMYVLTTDKIMYATGIYGTYNENALWNYNFPGWSEKLEDNYSLVEILNNVDYFKVYGTNKMALSNNMVYSWGLDYYGNLEKTNYVPTEWDLSNTLDTSDIKRMYSNYSITQILMNDGSLFIKAYKSGDDQGKIARYSDGKWYNITSEFKNDTVIDIATMGNSATYQLTQSGNVYGWGAEKFLGIGSKSENAITTSMQLGLENINQITVGNGFAIAVTKEGKVYGTGLNTYGILGRWVGVGRGESNSRYKTAFDWVECPDLEI